MSQASAVDPDMVRVVATRHGIVPVVVAAEDGGSHDEIRFYTVEGRETGIAVRCAGRFYVAIERTEREKSPWIGWARANVKPAINDAIDRFLGRRLSEDR